MNDLTIDVHDEPRPFSAVRPVTVTGPRALELPLLVEALRTALQGGPPLLPVPEGEPAVDVLEAARGVDEPLAPGTVLLLPTSGSTGRPKVVELSGRALLAGAQATHARIGAAGRWLLALPLTHIAGWQVLVRGLLAGAPLEQVPTRVDPDVSFTPEAFCVAAVTDVRFTSLVPTQLSRLLDHPESTRALARLQAVLVGGAATPPRLVQRAADAGVRLIRTYGSTETSGGCLYDGQPLDGVRVDLTARGLLRISGPMLATRYRGAPELSADTFGTDEDGRRWYLTSDRAEIDADGRVQIRGRADDTIITGGENVAPAAVETVLLSISRIREAIVVGLPHPEWGQQVAAVISLEPTATQDIEDEIAVAVEQRLGRHCAPKVVVVVDEVPHRGIGKPDRRAAQLLALRVTGQQVTEEQG